MTVVGPPRLFVESGSTSCSALRRCWFGLSGSAEERDAGREHALERRGRGANVKGGRIARARRILPICAQRQTSHVLGLPSGSRGGSTVCSRSRTNDHSLRRSA